VGPGDTLPTPGNACPGEWIATDGSSYSNWAYTDASASPPTRKAKAILGRYMADAAGVDSAPDTVVEDQAVQSGRALPNPFNHVIVFREPNRPGGGAVVPGALAFGCFAESDGHLYFAFAFQGTGSSTTDLSAAAEETTFHAGMGLFTSGAIRMSVFAGRFK
jgi:transposase